MVVCFGGDEFVVVFFDIDSVGVMVVVVRLCEWIVSYEFLWEEGCQLNLIVSIGVVMLLDDVLVVDYLF